MIYHLLEVWPLEELDERLFDGIIRKFLERDIGTRKQTLIAWLTLLLHRMGRKRTLVHFPSGNASFRALYSLWHFWQTTNSVTPSVRELNPHLARIVSSVTGSWGALYTASRMFKSCIRIAAPCWTRNIDWKRLTNARRKPTGYGMLPVFAVWFVSLYVLRTEKFRTTLTFNGCNRLILA